MGRFDQAADPFGIAGQLRNRQSMADGGQIGVVHRLIGFGLDRQANVFVMRQHFVERRDEQLDAAPAIFRLALVGALAREPEHQQIRAEIIGDVDRTEGTFESDVGFF